MWNVIKEAAKFGGEGWRTYDQVFRAQAAVKTEVDWTAFFPGGPKTRTVQICSLCHESDHQATSCALAPLSHTSKRPSPGKLLARQHSPASDGQQQLCISWNQGACMFPGSCNYKHQCASCSEPHIVRDYSLTPEDCAYKRPPKRAARALIAKQ